MLQSFTKLGAVAAAVAALSSLPQLVSADGADAVYAYNQQPNSTWQHDQVGLNNCAAQFGSYNETASCVTAVVNSGDDFCLFAPPKMDIIANTEQFVVSYCTKPGYGSRLIPDGTLSAVHTTKTNNYIQVIAKGNFSLINVAAGDPGGELDPHGADGEGNPKGGLVYSNAWGGSNGMPAQTHQWMEFMSAELACIRVCRNNDAYGAALCQHIYDVMGCGWVMPSDAYTSQTNAFDSCDSEDGEPPGVYGQSTWYQGECGVACAPSAHPAPSSSNCKVGASPANKVASLPNVPISTTSTPAPTPTSSSSGGANSGQSSGSSGGSSSSGSKSGAVSSALVSSAFVGAVGLVAAVFVAA